VPLSFRHDGQRHDVFVRLMGVHANEELLEKIQKPAEHPQPKPRSKPKAESRLRSRSPPMPTPHCRRKRRSAAVKKLIQARKGYANYYFNELNRDRVWQAFRKHGDFSHTADTWQLAGTARTAAAWTSSWDRTKRKAAFRQRPGSI